MMAVLAISGSLSAQVIVREEAQLFEPDEQVYDPYLYLTPFSDAVGYSIYGSQYRKARATRSWGVNLCLVSAPLFGPSTIFKRKLIVLKPSYRQTS